MNKQVDHLSSALQDLYRGLLICRSSGMKFRDMSGLIKEVEGLMKKDREILETVYSRGQMKEIFPGVDFYSVEDMFPKHPTVVQPDNFKKKKP